MSIWVRNHTDTIIHTITCIARLQRLSERIIIFTLIWIQGNKEHQNTVSGFFIRADVGIDEIVIQC